MLYIKSTKRCLLYAWCFVYFLTFKQMLSYIVIWYFKIGATIIINDCFVPPQFFPGTNAISLVSHAPDIQPGDLVNIVNSWNGNLCTVKLPNGMIHRWFASFELSSNDIYSNCPLAPGKFVTVISSEGHGNPPHVEVGTTVKIVRCIPTTFFDVILNNGEYHRWLAGFELANPV